MRWLVSFGIATLLLAVCIDALSQSPNASAGAPTPTPVVREFSYENLPQVDDTAELSDNLDLYVGPYTSFAIVANAPGCGVPSIVSESLGLASVFEPGAVNVEQFRINIRWPERCVEVSDELTVEFSMANEERFVEGALGINIGVVPPTFIPPGSFYSSLPPIGGPSFPWRGEPASVAIDCDVDQSGIQDSCDAPIGGSLSVDVYLTTGHGRDFEIGALGFEMIQPDPTRLDAVEGPCPSPGLNCNPDFNQVFLTGTLWRCGPPFPSADHGPMEIGDTSFIGCFTSLDGPLMSANSVAKIARVNYVVPSTAIPGMVPISLRAVSVYTEVFREMHTCNYAISRAGICRNAVINVVDSGPISPTPTSTAPPAPSPTPTSAASSSTSEPTPNTPFFLAIDCDARSPGYQSTCTYPISTGSIDTSVWFFANAPGADDLAGFTFRITNHDRSRLEPIVQGDNNLNGNPNFNDVLLGFGFTCLGPPPNPDTGEAGPSKSVSRISCLANPPGPSIPDHGVELATIHYTIPSGASAGPVQLTASTAYVSTSPLPGFGSDAGSCNPASVSEMPCLPATITLVGPVVDKQPEGNANNTDLSIPAANLWICEVGPCAGPGEGALRVVERASGVVEGLGAYEFTVEYDNFVIQSVNPCDLVFGPGGAGSARGPVDELDASAINPDCAPDPGGANNGTCAMSLVLENLVHFGCATNGLSAGPTGDFDLASLLLIPHPDLNNDLFPGNNNGVLTVLKDNGCELVDTLGHPVSGSVNGGLTPYCRDLAVTVRILEGDLDLDCDVDLTDAQAIASRYGAFFGGLLYSKWYDLEPQFHDLDIDIKDVQKVFGRQGSTCQTPVPAQPPLGPPTAFGD